MDRNCGGLPPRVPHVKEMVGVGTLLKFDARPYLFDMGLGYQIQGPPGRFLALDSPCQDAPSIFRPGLQALAQPDQRPALLCFPALRFPSGGGGLGATQWSPKET